MIKTYITTVLVILLSCVSLFSRANTENGSVKGTVSFKTERLPYVNIHLKGTTIGVLSDNDGNYELKNLPLGDNILVFSMVGYKSVEMPINVTSGGVIELPVSMVEDVFGLDEVVITGDRTAQTRAESPVIVNSLSSDLFNSTQSTTLVDGLNYCTGLRTENNCSNCGFNQVRMNGLEGPYSQILINSRPIFSGLAGVYGLELIPVNMIQKVEVVRGGGSALYGSNAIAGTINLILQDPFRNTYEGGYSASMIGVGSKPTAFDHNISFNASVVSDDFNTGMSVYGFNRSRDPLDVNSDGFSDLGQIANFTMGARFFHRLNTKSKIAIDYFSINEERRGGNRFDYPMHEAEIAEAVKHKINTAAITYERFIGNTDLLSIYGSGQFVDRDSYYGANRSLSDYGYTEDRTGVAGAQYKTWYNNTSFVTGLEYIFSHLEDTKLGYRDYDDSTNTVVYVDNTTVANQQSQTLGAFGQVEFNYKKYKFTLGGRLDKYMIRDLEDIVEDKDGLVFSPRINVMYDIKNNLKTRVSYSKGYRAPQIFDEDLHINTSGSRQVVFENDPNLEEETSYSFMASLDYNTQINKLYMSFLLEGFYTRLDNPFANEYGEPDEDGVVVYTRVNSENGATIKGINTEMTFKPRKDLGIALGATFQSSRYDDPQEFDEDDFFRSPNTYGFIALDYDFINNLCFSVSGSYTGSMLVPYFGPELENPEEGELRVSQSFFDLGVKLEYLMEFKSVDVKIFGGVKNIFNSYQSDHDYGIDKDPGYIYGPGSPRTVYVGLKFGNVL